MRSGIALLTVWLLLTGCGQRPPDFRYSIKSPAHGAMATVSGYQPRGTVEGYLLIAFGDDAQSVAQFRHIKNAALGWVSGDEFAVVGDFLSFDSIRSSYFPDGAAASEIRLITCSRRQVDCALLERRMIPGSARRIAQFPEGDWYVATDAR